MAGISDFSLKGRVALVTGGTSGIGRGIAAAFASAGAKVAVVGHRNLEAGNETVAELKDMGADAMFIACDVRDPVQVDTMVAKVVERFGGLHVAVNNAMQPTGASDLFDPRAIEAWPRAINGFLSAPFWCCRAEAAHMKEHGGGSIINIASIGAYRGAKQKATTGLIAYGASKAGLLHMTRMLAADWARFRIRVNSISPGLIRTPATQVLTERPDLVAKELAAIPARRLGEPADIGGAALFLASDASDYTTGIDIVVDGGSII